MEFYTYIWRDASGVPFYVGKGKGRRARQLSGRSVEFKAIHSQGGCSVDLVDMFIHESQAHAHEIELIERFGRREMGGLLINKTDGGDGTSGAIRTAEHKAKISASKVGKPRPDWLKEHLSALKKGVPLAPEHREAISRAQIGLTHTESARKKIGDAHRGKTISAEQRRSISDKLSGRKLSASHVKKMSSVASARYQSPDEREKTAISLRILPPDRTNTTGYKGVSYRKDRDKWRATIKVGDKVLSLGVFGTPELAARAYDAAAIAAWGAGNCYLNFPLAT